MGASAAVTRVLVVAMVRDLFEREAMARVMSLVFMVFMLMPVLAPNIGIAILLFAPWQAIFGALALYALVMLVWSGVRMPETLHPEYRRSLRFGDMAEAVLETVREPLSRGYTLALTISFGALVAYIASIQQIVFDAFREPRLIGLVFAAIAAPMALASWTNSRVVGRFGLRRVGHSASAAFAVIAILHLAVALSGRETLLTFVLFQGLTMCAFAFTSSNLSTLAMEHMAPIAGTASSVQGMLGTVGAAIIGFVIGQPFNGTVLPYLVGTAGCAVGGFIAVVLTEPETCSLACARNPTSRHCRASPTRSSSRERRGGGRMRALSARRRGAAIRRSRRRPRRRRPSAPRRLPRSSRGSHFRCAARRRDFP